MRFGMKLEIIFYDVSLTPWFIALRPSFKLKDGIQSISRYGTTRRFSLGNDLINLQRMIALVMFDETGLIRLSAPP